MKFAPTFPERFATLADARAWMDTFSRWYNYEHHHGGIGLHTPADVHYGRAGRVDRTRAQALVQARQAHPERFATTRSTVAGPKILDLPETTWINKPVEDCAADDSDQTATTEQNNAAA